MATKHENDKKRSYEDALLNLTEVLSARERELDDREKNLQRVQEEIEADRMMKYGDTCPSDVLGLNIGGTKISVLRRTLTSVPGSMLASRFSGRWDDSIEKDKDGNFFIDQEYSMFRHVIQYLRDKANGDDKYTLVSPFVRNESFHEKNFYRMLEYYGITDGLFPVELLMHKAGSMEGLKSKQIDANKFTSLSLGQIGHNRRIKTYEVMLGTVQRIQIGWRHDDIDMKIARNSGAGDIDGTIALDLIRTCLLVDGTATSADGLEHSEGTVIRSENKGKKWYVNGKPVAPFSEGEWKKFQKSRSGRGGYIPFLSVQGDIEVTSVELAD